MINFIIESLYNTSKRIADRGGGFRMASAWTEKEAAHLLGRATFLATKAEVAAALKLGREETVRRLMAGDSLTDKPEQLQPITAVKSDGKSLQPDKIADQETYWLYRMANTEAPL